MLTLIYLIPMMDDLRVLEGSFKNVNSTVDYVNLLVICSNIVKIKKKNPQRDGRRKKGTGPEPNGGLGARGPGSPRWDLSLCA